MFFTETLKCLTVFSFVFKFLFEAGGNAVFISALRLSDIPTLFYASKKNNIKI
jgi:hypothetical protein